MELQNLLMGRKCIQFYLRIFIFIVIILSVIYRYVMKSHSNDAIIINSSTRVALNSSISSIYKFQTIQSSISVSNSTISASELNNCGSFVLALNYYEQLTCGTRNLFMLFQVVQNFDAKVVIPFLWTSSLRGIPNDLIYDPTTSTNYYPFSTVYNMHKLNISFCKWHLLCDI